MAQEEFVILLGEEDSSEQVEQQAAAASTAAAGEFVILLDDEPVASAQGPVADGGLALPALATIGQVNAFYQKLAEHIEAGHDVAIAGAEVEQFDTAFAQLLLATCKKCGQLSRTFRLVEASPALVSACQRLAVAKQLLQEGGDKHAA